MVKAGTSIGANYSEADDAESKGDFRQIGSAKESRESKHFIRMIVAAKPDIESWILWRSKKLNLIFNTIYIRLSSFGICNLFRN